MYKRCCVVLMSMALLLFGTLNLTLAQQPSPVVTKPRIKSQVPVGSATAIKTEKLQMAKKHAYVFGDRTISSTPSGQWRVKFQVRNDGSFDLPANSIRFRMKQLFNDGVAYDKGVEVYTQPVPKGQLRIAYVSFLPCIRLRQAFHIILTIEDVATGAVLSTSENFCSANFSGGLGRLDNPGWDMAHHIWRVDVHNEAQYTMRFAVKVYAKRLVYSPGKSNNTYEQVGFYRVQVEPGESKTVSEIRNGMTYDERLMFRLVLDHVSPCQEENVAGSVMGQQELVAGM